MEAVLGDPLPIDWPASVASDRQRIRTIEMIVSRKSELGRLAALEIPTTTPTIIDGERIVYITTTGADAESLRSFGFQPTLPRHRLRAGTVSTLADSPVPEPADLGGVLCIDPPIPIDTGDCDFPMYDDTYGACNNGIAKELEQLDYTTGSGISVRNAALGQTQEHRHIAAVRFGPDPFAAADIPTHYIFGTHHAREWMTTAVTMKLIRWLDGIAKGVIDDPSMEALLRSAAVVIVPVVNPDGYQRTRAPGGDRSWRGNRHSVAACPDAGVDINRNYAGNWGDTPVDSVDSSPPTVGACSQIYQGPAAASEVETQQMQLLMNGGVPRFANDLPYGVSATSYHSWGNLIVYPTGYKRNKSDTGPRCDPNANCLAPDFLSLRHLYGNHRSPILYDAIEKLLPGGAIRPYFADQERSNGYTTTGDLTQFASTRAKTPMLSVTPELGGQSAGGFYPECRNPQQRSAIVNELVEQQKNLVRRLLSNTHLLKSSGFPSATTGFIGGGFIPREKVNDRTDETAIPRLMMARARSAGADPTISYDVGGSPTTFTLQRQGAQYNLYGYEPPSPMRIPCQIGNVDQGAGFGCTGEVDLCDETRLAHSGGWTFFTRTTIDGHEDCGYVAKDSSSSSSVTLPAITPPPTTTQCHVMFTLRWSAPSIFGSNTQPVRLERLVGGGWSEITRWPLQSPYFELRTAEFSAGLATPNSLRSYAFEVGGEGGAPTDPVRLTYEAGTAQAFELLDAVVGCRYGRLGP